MSIIGSSSISIRGFTGPSGPEGPIGPTGNTGINATGCNEATGSKGTWLDSLQWDIGGGAGSSFQKLLGNSGWGSTYTNYEQWESLFHTGDSTMSFGWNVKIRDNKQKQFNVDVAILAGSTFYIGEYHGTSYSDSSGVIGATAGNLSLFTGISSGSFVFRSFGISGSGLTVGSDSNHIYIDTTQISAGSSGFGQNELLYWISHSQHRGITLDNGFTLGYVSQPSGTTKDAYFSLNSRTLSKSKIKTIEVSNPQGITLDLTEAGVFYIHTPAKITGFTGTTGWHPGTVYSTTLILENDYVFQFPTNIVFPKNNNTLSCGENIINLTSIDAGKTWLANIFGKGFRSTTSTCHSSWDIGSCTVGTTCENYVTRWECEKQNGIFCLAACTTGTTYAEGSCCVNGVCRDGVSQFRCNKYGGRFWSQQQTGGSGCNAFSCWDPCFPTIGSCCIGLTCMDRHTESECDLLNGRWNPWPCSTPFACEPLADSRGACCKSKTQCEFISWRNCALQGGLFMGIGEQCADVNCNCFEDEGGSGGDGSFIAIPCNSAGITFAVENQVVFKEYKIDLTDLDFDEPEEICLTYKTYSAKDRFIITKTNHQDSDIKNILQGPVATNYTTDQYSTFAQVMDSHPAYYSSTDPDGFVIEDDSVIHDTRCVGTDLSSNSFTVIVNPTDIELTPDSDWFKQLRLWIIAGCEPSDHTLWDVNIQCNACASSYGACCHGVSGCVWRSEAECIQHSGVWKGQGTLCESQICHWTDCPPYCPPPPGCPEDPAKCPTGCPNDPTKCPPPLGCPEDPTKCPPPPTCPPICPPPPGCPEDPTKCPPGCPPYCPPTPQCPPNCPPGWCPNPPCDNPPCENCCSCCGCKGEAAERRCDAETPALACCGCGISEMCDSCVCAPLCPEAGGDSAGCRMIMHRCDYPPMNVCAPANCMEVTVPPQGSTQPPPDNTYSIKQFSEIDIGDGIIFEVYI